MNLGARIKEVRERLNISQPELSRKSGISQQALSNLEQRDSKTSEWAPHIADALGVSLRWLLTGSGRPEDMDRWPFGRVDRARWDRASDEDRSYVQAMVNRALDDCEGLRPDESRKPPPQLAA
jgi:transcriptional regulator with XRE-family HTH domain